MEPARQNAPDSKTPSSVQHQQAGVCRPFPTCVTLNSIQHPLPPKFDSIIGGAKNFGQHIREILAKVAENQEFANFRTIKASRNMTATPTASATRSVQRKP